MLLILRVWRGLPVHRLPPRIVAIGAASMGANPYLVFGALLGIIQLDQGPARLGPTWGGFGFAAVAQAWGCLEPKSNRNRCLAQGCAAPLSRLPQAMRGKALILYLQDDCAACHGIAMVPCQGHPSSPLKQALDGWCISPAQPAFTHATKRPGPWNMKSTEPSTPSNGCSDLAKLYLASKSNPEALEIKRERTRAKRGIQRDAPCTQTEPAATFRRTFSPLTCERLSPGCAPSGAQASRPDAAGRRWEASWWGSAGA